MSGNGPKPGGAPFSPGSGFGGGMSGLSEQGDAAELSKALGSSMGGASGSTPSPQAAATPPPPPREMGTISEELGRIGSDLTKGLLDFGQFATWFGFEPGALSAEQKQHLKTVHQNYQRLSQEEQAIVRQKHQEHQQRKQMIAQEDARRHQQEEAAQSQVAMPSGPKKGAQGGKKTATPVQRMQDKRKQLGGPGDVN